MERPRTYRSAGGVAKRRLVAIVAITAASAFALTPLAPARAGQQAHRSPGELAAVLISVPDGVAVSAAVASVLRAGGVVADVLPHVRTVAAALPEHPVLPAGFIVAPDREIRVTATATAPTSGTSTVPKTIASSPSATGAGVTVAVVDTGVADVPGLSGALAGHLNVSGAQGGDGYGHGTFMAGLVAGRGATGEPLSAAPDAKVLDVQVADETGATSLAKVLAGLEAIAEWRRTDGSLRVVNLSLSSSSPLPPALDPLAKALEILWNSGLVVVTSAGNDGPRPDTISSPGDDPVLLTVGALDENRTPERGDDSVAGFSARDRGHGSAGKPDLVAPGVSVVSLRAPGSIADTENPQARVGDAYFRGSGSSMSAAVVSGAAAALLSARPNLTPEAVKALLVESAYAGPLLRKVDGAGAGGLDMAAALTAKVPRSPSRASAPDPSQLGPVERDSHAWGEFTAAWGASDYAATLEAWHRLSPQTQRWASQAWAVDVVLAATGMDDTAFEARAWSARAWSARAWSAGAWSSDAWLARAWSARAWSARAWSARAWSARAWSARAWSARAWSDWMWSARAWSARAWSARAWSMMGWDVSP